MGEGLLYDTGIYLGCIGRVCSSCFISGTRRVTMTTSLEDILYLLKTIIQRSLWWPIQMLLVHL
jgi:hypothetical protein